MLKEKLGSEIDTLTSQPKKSETEVDEIRGDLRSFLQINRQLIEETVSNLSSPIRRKVIEMYFGLGDGIERSYEDVGIKVNLGPERVRQILVKFYERIYQTGITTNCMVVTTGIKRSNTE